MIIDMKNNKVDISNDMKAINDEMDFEITLFSLIKRYFLQTIADDIDVGLEYDLFRNELIAKGIIAMDGNGYYEMAKDIFETDILDSIKEWVNELINNTKIIKEE